MKILTVRQMAAKLGRSEKAVYHLVKRGRLPAVKLDGRVQFDERSVDAVLAYRQR